MKPDKIERMKNPSKIVIILIDLFFISLIGFLSGVGAGALNYFIYGRWQEAILVIAVMSAWISSSIFLILNWDKIYNESTNNS